MQLQKGERYTVRDYRSWDDGQRWELIDGVAYAVSPAPRPRHQRIAGRVFSALQAHLGDGRCEAFFSPVDVYLLCDETGDTVVQPDVLVICDPSKIREHGIVGAPDFIVEILSPSTAGRDFYEKLKLYERVGVAEYWIVSPDEKAVFKYTLEGGAFIANKVSEGMLASKRLQGFTLDVPALFDSLESIIDDG